MAFVLLSAASLSFAQAESQPAILRIVVNGLDHGQQFVRITENEDVLLTVGVLEQLRLKPGLWAGVGEKQVSLRALGELDFSLNENDALLTLTVPLRWLEEQVIEPEPPPAPATQPDPILPQRTSAFLNYSARANVAEQGGLTSLELPLELGINRGQWLGLNTSLSRYEADNDDTETVRQRTALIWDDPENLQRFTFGDFTQPYGLIQGGGNFGGISFRKRFQLDRNFRYATQLGLETRIESPTRAELYVNGRLQEEWDLLPGIVNFPGISSYATGDAELVLTDAFGRVRRLQIPAYTGQSVLKQGVHDYAYSLGWQRENYGSESADYGERAVMGYHRYGMTETLTGSVSFAATSDQAAAGASITALLGGFSQADLGYVTSRDHSGERGNTATGRYSYGYKGLNGFVAVTGTSRDYVHVPSSQLVESGSSQPRLLVSSNVSYSGPGLGTIGLLYSEARFWSDDAGRSRRVSLSYRRPLGRGLHLSLGVRHGLEGETADEAFLTLRYQPGASAASSFDTMTLATRHLEGAPTETEVNIQKNPTRTLGTGYGTTFVTRDGDVFGSARGQSRIPRGVFTGYASRDMDGQWSGSVSAAGGLALIDGGLYQGRPITDSFAVVRVTGAEGVTVEKGGAPVGLAGQDQPLLVPDLNSYGMNRVAVATPNLSLRYTTSKLRQEVAVRQRSGSIVEFAFSQFTAVEGSLYMLTADNQKVPLEHMPIEYSIHGEKREAFAAHAGYFYLEHLPPGRHVLRVRRWGGDCLASIHVTASDEIVQNLGETVCIPEKSEPTLGQTADGQVVGH